MDPPNLEGGDKSRAEGLKGIDGMARPKSVAMGEQKDLSPDAAKLIGMSPECHSKQITLRTRVS